MSAHPPAQTLRPALGPPDAAELLRRTESLCALTEVPGTITRTFLSPVARELHAALLGWAAELGLEARIDAAGNLRARAEGAGAARTLYIGSHLDTVPDGGRYDGLLGVLLGLALAGRARQAGDLPFHVEVLGFTEEEGVRFGVPFIGSRSAVGTVGELLGRTDADGVSVEAAMQDFGLEVSRLREAVLDPAAALGYLEFHIEQGPVLEAAGQPLGVVGALVGQSRLDLRLLGRANHAGTTPMLLRHDAMSAAAEFILAAERLARGTEGLVATVGQLRASPGATNVIPGEVTLSLDLRHADDAVRAASLERLRAELDGLCARRGVTGELQLRSEVAAVPLDRPLQALLHAAAAAQGLSAPDLVSGAGHDAMVLAPVMPAALLFLRTPGGVSHHPAEAVSEADVAAALEVGWAFLTGLAARETA